MISASSPWQSRPALSSIGTPTLTSTSVLRRFGTAASRVAMASSVGTVGCDRWHWLRMSTGLERNGMSPPPPLVP